MHDMGQLFVPDLSFRMESTTPKYLQLVVTICYNSVKFPEFEFYEFDLEKMLLLGIFNANHKEYKELQKEC